MVDALPLCPPLIVCAGYKTAKILLTQDISAALNGTPYIELLLINFSLRPVSHALTTYPMIATLYVRFGSMTTDDLCCPPGIIQAHGFVHAAVTNSRHCF